MKIIFCTTLLVAGLAGNVFVFGQGRADGGGKDKKDSVRILPPDKMACLVPSSAKNAPMPVKKPDIRMVRPMPNGTPDGKPRVEIVPKRRRE